MSVWKYRLTAVICGLLGAGLIGVVWRAMYFADFTASRLMFGIGMPLILLSALCGGLLVGAAALLVACVKQVEVPPRRGVSALRDGH